MTATKKQVKLESSESVKIHLHYLDHFFRVEQNEELQSEQRIKFFLSLTTIIIAFLSLYKNDSLVILAFFLFVLFILGLLVFARVIWSDRKIKKHQELWRISYEAIKNIDPSVVLYDKRLEEMNDEKILLPFRIIKGTLTQIMWFAEGILVGAFMFVVGTIINLKLSYKLMLSGLTTIFILSVLGIWIVIIKRGISKKVKTE